jgi:GntR family transcriptional regulator, transcriptional repressor for pyruvate dehydrogenase complex
MTDYPARVPAGRLTETISSLLESKILSGEWPPGLRLLSEPEMGAQLGVSRSVVRDAMRTLSARGLVDIRQGIGTTVASPTTEAYSDAIVLLLRRSHLTVGQVLDARELIEVELAGLAAARRTDVDCLRMRDSLDAYRRAVDAQDWQSAQETHNDFHLSILLAVNAPGLEILLLPLQEVILAAPLPTAVHDKTLWEVSEHERIASAIENGDVGAARELMKAHFAFRANPIYDEAFGRLFDGRSTERSKTAATKTTVKLNGLEFDDRPFSSQA